MTTHEFKAAGDHRSFKKRLILLLDGTWNDSDFGPSDTNIVRLREIIARTLAKQARAKGSAANNGDLVHPFNDSSNVDKRHRDEASSSGPQRQAVDQMRCKLIARAVRHIGSSQVGRDPG